MNLTAEQIEAIREGEPVVITEPEIGDCVVLRKDVYERVATLIHDAEFSPREAYPFVDRVMGEDDAGDPALESYQQYRRAP